MAFDTHGVNGKPWTGFDLDGTLAVYDKWRGVANIGKPVRPMCELIRKMHDEGKSVKILTARVAPREDGSHHLARVFIARWCRDNLGFVPPITHEKDALMETLYDDRVKAVEQNTGKVLNMAKFKKGDRVVATKPDYQTKGVGVVRGYEYSWDEEIERDDPGWYIVDFPNQYKVKMGKGSLRLANSAVRSRAARNAEFKPGDVVSYRSANGMTWTGIVKSDMNGWCKPDEILVLRTGDTKPHVIPKRAVIPNSLRSRNAVVQKALNATGDRRDYYVVDEFGNAADGSKTPLPFDRASKLFLKLTGSKSGNGKWGIIRRGEPASKARDWYGNIVSWNADTSVLRETAVNSELVNLWHVMDDAKKIAEEGRTNHNVKNILRLAISAAEKEEPGHPSIKEARKILSMFNSSRSTNAVVAKALNARRVARNFTPQSEFQVGDVVRFRDSVRSVPHDETYTVVKVSGNNITIKGGRDNGTSVEFKNNLEIA